MYESLKTVKRKDRMTARNRLRFSHIAAALLALGLLLFTWPVLASGQRVRVADLTVAEAAEEVGMSSSRPARTDRILQGYIDRREIAGAVAMSVRRGKIFYHKAFGMADIEAGRPMRTDSIFRIASMSKPITSLAVMMLYEQGHFLLTDPISKFIPELGEMQVAVLDGDSVTLVPPERPITIRHMLNHTSGIPYIFLGRKPFADIYKKAGVDDGLDPQNKNIGDWIKRLAECPPTFQPGEKWEYSLSIDALGYLVEVISGMRFDRFLEERIFEPLGMKDTYFYPPDDKIPRLATVYLPHPEKGLVPWGEDSREFGYLVMRPSSAYTGDKFGLGFAIRTERGQFDEIESLGTYGWVGIYNTFFWIDPMEDMFGILMTQLFPTGHLPIKRQFRIMVSQAIAD